ncbi:MAG: DNA replication/repair protein RecF [Candidatus Dormibacteria bacterium]|jgi:DNA replication and repair protein RecF
MPGPAPPAEAGGLTHLRLYNFRNYPELNLPLGPGLNVFAGENAQGKTNLLEAVATLLLTRSPRTSTPAELLRWGSDEAAVDAVLGRRSLSETLALRLRRVVDASEAGPPGRESSPRISRTTTRDGHPIAPRDLLGRWPVVLFWPDDLQLVKAGPEARRRLLDVLVSQLDHAAADELIRYRRVLEQRNALLRRLHDGGGPVDQLRPFDDALVRHGAAVQVARTELVAELAPLAGAAMAEISEATDSLELRYAPQSGLARDGLEQVMATLGSALARARAEELARGTSVVGPHRDDLEFVLNHRPARSTASQGQQRSAVLATKIAEVRLVGSRAGRLPILLLDDVLSELDAGRREHLLSALSASGEAPQTMVTCSDDHPFGAHPARRFRVRQGTVRSE